MKKIKQNFTDPWNTIKYSNIYMMGTPEGEEREKGKKDYLKK